MLCAGAPDFRAGIINKNTMPINNIDVWPLLKEIGNGSKRSRKQDVVTIKVRHNVAIDSREARIDRIGLPFVRDALPADFVAIAL